VPLVPCPELDEGRVLFTSKGLHEFISALAQIAPAPRPLRRSRRLSETRAFFFPNPSHPRCVQPLAIPPRPHKSSAERPHARSLQAILFLLYLYVGLVPHHRRIDLSVWKRPPKRHHYSLSTKATHGTVTPIDLPLNEFKNTVVK
jgi:hypothetical protein